jgi:phage baseplate assembly protein W
MAENPQLLKDIRLKLTHKELRPVYSVDTDMRRVPNRPDPLADLGVISGVDNLGQAVILRLLTPKGELSALAHPEYGSRLHELVGSQNTATTRNLAKLYILESLQLEPRIQKVAQVVVVPAQGARDRINIQLALLPVGETTTVRIGPFTLELGS